MFRLNIFLGFMCFCVPLAHGGIVVSKLFSDQAVIQRDRNIPISGFAEPGKFVEITLGEQTKILQSNAEGRWQVSFAPLQSGTVVDLTITSGEDEYTAKSLIAGDVWLCSGQSNMEWPLRRSDGGEDEQKKAAFRDIRHFKIPRSWSPHPELTLAGGDWQVAQEGKQAEFSGVGYYFAKKIHQATGVPVGLLCPNWGGSRIQAWMAAESLSISEQSASGNILEIIEEMARNTQRLKTEFGRWPGSVLQDRQGQDWQGQAKAEWFYERIDDEDWLSVEAPKLWESQGYAGVDGVIWYRKQFVLTAQQASEDLQLQLARIDDADVTWVNGFKVGETAAYDIERVYSVSAQLTKPGLNTIAIRVQDDGGGGGIYSQSPLQLTSPSGSVIPLSGQWKMRPDRVTLGPTKSMNGVPTALFNKMINPILNFPIKGVIWYQGESNASDMVEAKEYANHFKNMIKDWRMRWGQPQLPFYWVQLANFRSGGDSVDGESQWATVRYGQSQALALPMTGQAISIDVGNPDDIHPTDKKTVGERLAAIALHQTYSLANVVFQAPAASLAQLEGHLLVLKFKRADELMTRDGGQWVKGLTLSDDRAPFITVSGRLVGGDVIIQLPEGFHPKRVRYGWKDNPVKANLVGRNGLPVGPFEMRVIRKNER